MNNNSLLHFEVGNFHCNNVKMSYKLFSHIIMNTANGDVCIKKKEKKHDNKNTTLI